MSKITPQDVQKIKENIDFVSLVQRYVQLKQSGERWWGPCPFHQETKPSFSVVPEKGLFYCFGCNASGDVIDFYSRINGLDFVEAVRDLASEAGVGLSRAPKGSDPETSQRNECLRMHAIAQDYFSGLLKRSDAKKPRRYLEYRGITEDLIQRFGLGWSPDAWEGLKRHLESYGYTPLQGVRAGLLSQNRSQKIYDRFRARITFPIYDLSGRVIAFGGRLVEDGDPKYLNSSESVIFKKGENLFGLYQARRSITPLKEVFLTEGYADVITMHQYGYTNACGVLGTALTKKQVQRLSGLCKRVFLVFDGDSSGEQAAMRSAEMILNAGMEARVVHLPEKEDVDSLLKNKGSVEFDRLVGDFEDGLEFCFKRIRYDNSPQSVMRWALNFFKNIRDNSLKAYYLPRFAKGLNIAEFELRKALETGVKEQKQVSKKDSLNSSGAAQRDRELLSFAIRFPEYRSSLRQYEIKEALSTDRGKQFWEKLDYYRDKEVLPYLDEGEKQFFVQSSVRESREDPEVLWWDIKEFLVEYSYRRKKKSLLESLQKAEKEGNQKEVHSLLKEYSNILKGEG